ncbi:DEAD/DEAH box helicase [Neoroseomonas oryzicola]|uniref:DEAD/DEAH box helicase n=3 Tax=Neoroseomonas oryzicola TaxID=535904 RepID=A0ABX1EG51_9PROT|nr:DEAD/DEAH box helicase [Neoroseomonas oryzicola]NKE16793.1 DEAD/DEAH box helicase [Neoroseomonas oryzicola]
MTTTFEALGLDTRILQALAEEGYSSPTPIQAQSIPSVMEGRDLLGIAQTGTGKTAAFSLPILHRLAQQTGRPPRYGCRVLVLSPTRELASQIADSVRAYGRHLGLSTTVVFGGVGFGGQKSALARGVDILVATPGRLQDLIDQGAARLDHVTTLVLDEADQMLDKGFLPAIRRLLKAIPQQRQTLFFSATMPAEINKLAAEMLTDPVRVAVAPVATTAEKVAQRVIHLPAGGKRQALAELLRMEGIGRTLVFSRTKHGADRIVKQLDQDGIAANAIHGNKAQNARERALAAFRDGSAPVLVATDIAARGIDVDGVTHVIQFDLPEVPETYVHRIGRTARAGATGEAIALCSHEDRDKLRAIERLIRQQIPAETRSGAATPEPARAPAPRQPQQQKPPRGAHKPQRQPQHRPGGHATPAEPKRQAEPPRPQGGDSARRRPAAGQQDAPRRDRSWREGDFRDGSPAPAFLRRGR